MIAENSCVICRHELTCGYSMLATIGKRDEKFSYGPCVLKLMSCGKPFFEAKEAAPQDTKEAGEQQATLQGVNAQSGASAIA